MAINYHGTARITEVFLIARFYGTPLALTLQSHRQCYLSSKLVMPVQLLTWQVKLASRYNMEELSISSSHGVVYT